jgi:hypothetical protein
VRSVTQVNSPNDYFVNADVFAARDFALPLLPSQRQQQQPLPFPPGIQAVAGVQFSLVSPSFSSPLRPFRIFNLGLVYRRFPVWNATSQSFSSQLVLPSRSSNATGDLHLRLKTDPLPTSSTSSFSFLFPGSTTTLHNVEVDMDSFVTNQRTSSNALLILTLYNSTVGIHYYALAFPAGSVSTPTWQYFDKYQGAWGRSWGRDNVVVQIYAPTESSLLSSQLMFLGSYLVAGEVSLSAYAIRTSIFPHSFPPLHLLSFFLTSVFCP